MDSHYEGREYDLDIQDRPQECIQRLNQDLQSPTLLKFRSIQIWDESASSPTPSGLMCSLLSLEKYASFDGSFVSFIFTSESK